MQATERENAEDVRTDRSDRSDQNGHTEPLIRVRGLKKYFPHKHGFLSRKRQFVKAVDGLSFDIMPNQTVGLVGESGCGKTTAGRTLLRLLEPTAGEAIFRNRNIFELGRRELRALRRHMQIIFQDPFSSLNPRMTVEKIIGDAVQVHGIARGGEMRELVRDLLERVGLQPQYANRYPHEFSGGQRQRIGIARALALNPDFIVCDEAVSALDVSVQAQVLNLLEELQEEFELSFLFIAHDLSVVRHIADRVCVMYLGQIVEAADCDELFEEPLHPYTQALLSAIPHPRPGRKTHRIILEGDVPSPINPPTGCRFHTRCPVAFGACSNVVPKDIEVEDGHKVKCHLYDDEITGIPKASVQRTRDTWRLLLQETRRDAGPRARTRALRPTGHRARPHRRRNRGRSGRGDAHLVGCTTTRRRGVRRRHSGRGPRGWGRCGQRRRGRNERALRSR